MEDFFLPCEPEHLGQGRIHFRNTVISGGQINAFPQRLKKVRKLCLAFPFTRDIACQAADSVDHIVANNRMEHAFEVARRAPALYLRADNACPAAAFQKARQRFLGAPAVG